MRAVRRAARQSERRRRCSKTCGEAAARNVSLVHDSMTDAMPGKCQIVARRPGQRYAGRIMALILSILMLATLLLLAGAFVLWRRGGSLKQVLLMVLLAVVMAVNVGIWTLPDASGTAPLGRELK